MFEVNAWNRLAMLGDSESGLFITQSCFGGITSIELAEKTNFESLFAGADNEKAVDNFNLRTEDLLTDFFSDIEDSSRGIILVTDTEIQASNEFFTCALARIRWTVVQQWTLLILTSSVIQEIQQNDEIRIFEIVKLEHKRLMRKASWKKIINRNLNPNLTQ